MTCSRIILQTRSVTGGDFPCTRQLETPLRCKLQEKIASCDSALRNRKHFPCFHTVIETLMEVCRGEREIEAEENETVGRVFPRNSSSPKCSSSVPRIEN